MVASLGDGSDMPDSKTVTQKRHKALDHSIDYTMSIRRWNTTCVQLLKVMLRVRAALVLLGTVHSRRRKQM